ncbi:hypothetical protein SPBR_03155 [Sporothrix brasiliensis 5110]|uniref:Uncharacterized protein n=1 Tax=Sporothrix brasiliensis 5110 TaxID=1398154 RepID=A0A0C2J2I8_9PEZI|nr:uncharacterized protein SPBR_03155 [Sporothrix brasiliensis 5110]KIH93255.1 hypothetical protein SPBR_03155 [Sporothrix brasiliensis 5110]
MATPARGGLPIHAMDHLASETTSDNKDSTTTTTTAPPTPTRTRGAAASEAEQEAINEYWRQSRLSLPDVVRIPLATMASFTVGMGLGIAHGSTMAGMRFRAEHAHKLPTSTTGWYLYHKSKNYHVAYGGIREGLRMGAKVSVWTTAMFGIETLFDHYRDTKDVANTVLACVTVAGGFSLWNRFPLATAARTTKTAILVGFVYGSLQDLAGLARGRRISYVDYVQRKLKSRSQPEVPDTPAVLQEDTRVITK